MDITVDKSMDITVDKSMELWTSIDIHSYKFCDHGLKY